VVNYLKTLSSEDEISENFEKILNASRLDRSRLFKHDNYVDCDTRNMITDLSYRKILQKAFAEARNTIDRDKRLKNKGTPPVVPEHTVHGLQNKIFSPFKLAPAFPQQLSTPPSFSGLFGKMDQIATETEEPYPDPETSNVMTATISFEEETVTLMVAPSMTVGQLLNDALEAFGHSAGESAEFSLKVIVIE
jgi:hypothetical protein